jgi:hypothetical protein
MPTLTRISEVNIKTVVGEVCHGHVNSIHLARVRSNGCVL